MERAITNKAILRECIPSEDVEMLVSFAFICVASRFAENSLGQKSGTWVDHAWRIVLPLRTRRNLIVEIPPGNQPSL
jgi:hypothetical protein